MTTWTNLTKEEKTSKVDEWCALAPQFERIEIASLARYVNGMRLHQEYLDDWLAHNTAYAATYNAMLKKQGGNGNVEIAHIIGNFIK